MDEAERTSPSPSGPEGKVSKLLGKFGWLLPFHGLHHMYLMALPPLFPLLRETLVPSYTLLGLLRGVFTGVGFAVILAGQVADRIGERTAILLGFIVVPLFLIASALSPSYWILLVFVAGYGLARCMYHPAGLSFLSKSVPPSLHGKAIGLHESAGSLGSGLAFASLGIIGGALGWRWALVIMAIPGILLTLTYFFFRHETVLDNFRKRRSQHASKKSSDEKEGEEEITSFLERVLGIDEKESKPFWFQMTSKMVGGMGRVGFVVFLASFLTTSYGISTGLAGGLIGLSYLGSLVGNILGGKLAEVLGLVRTYVTFTLLAAVFMAAIAALQLPLYVLIICLSAAFLCSAIRNPSDKALLAERSHSGGRGAGYGSYFTLARMSAFVSGPLFGFLIENLGMRSTYFLPPVLMALAGLIYSRINRYRTRRVDTVQ